MLRPQGYGILIDPALPCPIEQDTFTCSHCNRIVIVKPLRPPEEMGGFCHGCSGLMCENCTRARELGGPCVTWQQILDKIEARNRALQSYGM